ncbi:S-norcoclaurine synthase 2 [Forsythia ovata]|uniref:S-norcoclaurine synthase 2 n=1 Tax=Forsythia ovata TaxID=205694 RepID=A0ABD1XAA4_9LAMI
MFGTVSDEREVGVPASEAWKLYGSLELAKIVGEALPNLFEKIEVVEGGGGAGTIIKLYFPPGAGLAPYKEKFTVVDDEKRVKETEVVEGGFLDMGFTLYRVRLQVIEKENNSSSSSCITKSTIEYEVKEESAANASFVSIQPLVNIMDVAANYLESKS